MNSSFIVETSVVIPIKIRDSHNQVIRTDHQLGNRVYQVRAPKFEGNFEAKVCFHKIINTYTAMINGETIFIAYGIINGDEVENLADASFSKYELVCLPYATRFTTHPIKSISIHDNEIEIISDWSHPLSTIRKRFVHRFDPITGNSSQIEEHQFDV